jgi:hypothetical protein
MISLHKLILEIQNDDAYESVKQYQNGLTVSGVQAYLRKKSVSSKNKTQAEYKQFLQNQVDNLDSAIKAAKTYPVDTVFWRGVGSKSFYKDKTFDLGYTSVSIINNDTVQSFGLGGVIMKLIVATPLKGLDMNKYLKSSDIDGADQEEVLLERGLTFILEKESPKFNTYKITK